MGVSIAFVSLLEACSRAVCAMQIDDQFRQLLSGTEADPMVVHFADISLIMVSGTSLSSTSSLS